MNKSKLLLNNSREYSWDKIIIKYLQNRKNIQQKVFCKELGVSVSAFKARLYKHQDYIQNRESVNQKFIDVKVISDNKNQISNLEQQCEPYTLRIKSCEVIVPMNFIQDSLRKLIEVLR